MQERIKKFWFNVSAYYRQQIPDQVIEMYAYDCRNFKIEDLQKAFEQYRKSLDAKFMPLPVQLINIIEPPFDETAEANQAVALIVEAITKFGQYQAIEAKQFVGEFCWEVITGCGGYNSLCMGQLDAPVKAQIRELAKSKIVRWRQGRIDKKPLCEAVPPSERHQNGLQKLDFSMKKLETNTNTHV